MTQASAADLVQEIRNTTTVVAVALSCEGIQISLDEILLDEIAGLIDHDMHGLENATARLSAAMVLLTDITAGTRFTSRRYAVLENRTRHDWARATTGFQLGDLEGFGVLPSDLGGVWMPSSTRIVTRRPDGTREEDWVPVMTFHSNQEIERAASFAAEAITSLPWQVVQAQADAGRATPPCEAQAEAAGIQAGIDVVANEPRMPRTFKPWRRRVSN